MPETTDTLTLKSVDKEDAGRYYCKIRNEVAIEEVHTDVFVSSRNQFIY